MTELTLYHAYTACSRVTLTALEQVGAPYADHMIDFRKGEHKQPAYLAINGQGKVPALVVDGQVLTENVAILRWLHATYPAAGLFPPAANAWEEAQQLSVLAWISSTWHPTVRAVKAPFMWTTGDVAPVQEKGGQLFRPLLDQLDAALAQRRWWFGDAWSIVDSYFWWATINSEFGGFDLGSWTNIARHRADNEAHPALQRALAREAAALAAIKEAE